MQDSANPNAKWEIALPNGSYSVRLVAGDPSYTDSTFRVAAEGQLVVQGTPTSSSPWVDGTSTISVSDGRLTVSNASGAVNNKLCFIEIAPAGSGGGGSTTPTVSFSADHKPRLLVTTDMGGDPDDRQSMIRLLSYANELEIEGLVASAAGTPGELGQSIVRPDLIRELVETYGQVRSNLSVHASDFPTTDYLRSVIKSGNPNRGTGHIGSGKDTEGSNFIISVVDQADSRPVNVAIWGGQTDLAQALWKVRNSRTSSAYTTFVSKLRIHDIGDQDGVFSYISSNFPGLFYVLDASDPKCSSAYRGMFYQGDTSLVTKLWIEQKVRTGHGPLGALYPTDLSTCGNGVNGVKEGDTPSWFYFLNNGLNVPGQPSWGGWGGRFARNGYAYRDASDSVNGTTSKTATVHRWRLAYQNDFEARMDWQRSSSFSSVNHPPRAVVSSDSTRRIAQVRAPAGASFTLSAAGSTDPDGNTLSYSWWLYQEPSTTTDISLSGASSSQVTVKLGGNAAGKTAHLILEVRDNGSPQLRAYRRIVIEAQ